MKCSHSFRLLRCRPFQSPPQGGTRRRHMYRVTPGSAALILSSLFRCGYLSAPLVRRSRELLCRRLSPSRPKSDGQKPDDPERGAYREQGVVSDYHTYIDKIHI